MTRRLAAVLLVLLATTASPAAPAGAADLAADPAAGAPAVGQCSALSPAERDGESYGEAPVDCAAPHTAQVVAVALLPDRLDYDSAGLEVFALKACYAGQEQLLAASLRRIRLSAYDVAWFVPDATQQAAGARWVRCDLVLPSGRRLRPLPAVPSLGERPLDPAIARCMTRTGFRTVVCSDPHEFRANRTVRVPGERFRDPRGWSDLGMELCPLPRTRRDAAFAWPTRKAWQAGDRSMVCFVGEWS